MESESAVQWVNRKLFTVTGEHLTELQRVILQQVWHGKKYIDIANFYGCTEGHAKDVGSALWKQLTRTIGERVTKQNVRSLLERHIQTLSTQARSSPSKDTESRPQPSPSPSQDTLESPTFVGRTEAIAHLNTLVQQGARVIVIQGEGGLGKTTLAQTYLHHHGFEITLELLMAKESGNITPIERVVEEWFSRDLAEEPGQEFGVTLGRLKRHLEQRRIGILIDNLEPALDKDGRLIPAHRRYVELLRMLADHRGRSLTLITSRDRLCESSLTVEHYRLPRLELLAWSQFFHHRCITPTPAILQAAHHTYGGNAKAMGLLYGTVREDFDGDFDAYWQENSGDPLIVMDLKNLVANQFNRLQALDPDAYRLLCRLGCYRYQSVATIPTAGLMHLLWDVESGRQKQVISSLRNRSLIESAKGQYWLHPVIQAEAIARLRQRDHWHQDEWTLTHQQAAEFWTHAVTHIETLTDALQAWEAHYHYLAIQDAEAASHVILQSRDNQWGQFLPLGSTLYRMGLLQPVLSAIEDILPHVQADRNVSELHNILGDLLWITGQVHRAIASQQQAITIARSALASLQNQTDPSASTAHQCYTFRMIEIDSLLSIGLYHIDLWNLAEAIEQFKAVVQLGDQTDHQAWATKARVCWALALSYQGLHEEAIALATPIYTDLLSHPNAEDTARFAYFIQILGQTYTNVADVAKAQAMYQLAMQFAETSHYTQVHARTLNGLAELDRIAGNWDSANAHHQEAIALLETIGATCDLAESHFQLGLTLQACAQWQENHKTPGESLPLPEGIGNDRAVKQDEREEWAIAFQTAIQLFTTMNAPRQVEKVRLTIGTFQP